MQIIGIRICYAHLFVNNDRAVTCNSKVKHIFALEGLPQWSTGEACLALVPSSTLHVHVYYLRGALPVYWAFRMFSRPGE
jgi:hypothetical protein